MADLPFLPYGRQTVDDDDIAAVAAVLRGDWLTTGPAVDAFETALSERVGTRHAVACSSGTAALHLAALAAELGPDDWAVVPSMTFLATANCVRYVGGEVVFADVDPGHGLLEEKHLRDAMARAGGKVGAVLPVHLNGQACDMATLAETARSHGLVVIEDASHALGTTYSAGSREHRVGACAHSDMCVFSFHPVKTVTSGEGGAVTTNDDRLAERLRRMRNHGMVRDADRFSDRARGCDQNGAANPWYYEMPELGFNYRATDIHCALGLSQLGKLDGFAAQRRRLAARYDARLAATNSVRPVAKVPRSDAVLHLYAVLIDFAAAPLDRAGLMRSLNQQGIGTQVHYIPVHWQPYYEARYGRSTLPGSESYYNQVLSLPLHPSMREADVDRVVDCLQEALAA